MGNRNNNGSLFHQLINAPGLMERQRPFSTGIIPNKRELFQLVSQSGRCFQKLRNPKFKRNRKGRNPTLREST